MTLKEKVIGIWSLVSFQTQGKDGNIIYPLGKEATGYIMYHPEGYMSANLIRQGRKAYASGDMFEGTKEEMAEAAFGCLAYAGKFEVNEEMSTLIHHIEISMNPTWLGQKQPRVATVEGDLLKISSDLNANAKLVWKRV